MIKKFADESTLARRAQQAYLVLIGLAHNRQTITYGDLSVHYMDYGHGGILAAVLDRIMRWCALNKLPPLTALVVNQDSGLPGDGLVTVAPENVPAEQYAAFKFNWFAIIPATAEELEACAGVKV